MIIANYIVTQTELDQVWMVVSPHNPHKKKSSLAKDHDRLHMVRLAIGDNLKIKGSDIEFNLPQPSYTIDTLTYLKEKHPNKEFSLIMGGDNLATLHKWKNYESIINNYSILVYKRPRYRLGDLKDHHNVTICDAPLLQISASYIRRCIKDKKSIQYLVPDTVYEYLESTPLYK